MNPTCDRVREVLWPLDRPRHYVPEEDAAWAHLTRCSACRSFFLRDAEIARLLRRLRRGFEASPSPGLRLAVAKTLAERRNPGVGASGNANRHVIEMSRKRFRTLRVRPADLLAAAAASLLLIGGQLLAGRHDRGPDTARFAADFVRSAAVDLDQPGLDVEQIGDFYEKELGRHIVPVALHQAPVTRATVCELGGDLGSMIEYDLGGIRLVHYRIPLDPDRSRPKRTGIELGSDHGVHVASWSDTDFEHALVARTSPEELLWLAENRFNRPSITNYGSPASRSWRSVTVRN